MSERTEHSDAYWHGFGRALLNLSLDKERGRVLTRDINFEFMAGHQSACKVWATEERHAWGGSQDAVTRRVAELAVVLERRGESTDYGDTWEQENAYAQGLFDAAAIIVHRDPESAA